MNYQNIYDSLMAKAQQRATIEVYTERHHIIPKSEGGSDKDYNVVTLTAKEHYMAHYLLYKISPYNNYRMNAFLMMCQVDPSMYKERYRPPARVVAKIRELAALLKSQNYKERCWVKTATEQKFIYKAEVEQYIANGWVRGKHYTPTQATKDRIRDIRLSAPPVSKEFRQKMSDVVKKRYISNPESWNKSKETIAKLSDISKARWKTPGFREKHVERMSIKIKCPHCSVEGNKAIMTRWHFENCRGNNGNRRQD